MAFDPAEKWPIDGLEVKRVTFPRGVIETAAAPSHWLTLHVGEPVEVDCSCEDATFKGLQTPGALDFVPAGASGRWEDSGNADVVVVSIAPARLERVAASMGLGARRNYLRPKFQINDPQINHLVMALASLGETPDADDPSYVEGLSNLLMARFLAKNSDAARPHMPRRQLLSARQKRRVLEFIDAKLGERVSVADVARVAGISPSHFKELFRRTFGASVHQFVLQRRVDHAVGLIRRGGVPMADIAAAAGFAHQSHLARCMRRARGLTPSELARAIR